MTDQNQAGAANADGSARVSTRILGNVPVQLDAFVGGARMTVAELAALAADSVVALDTPLNQSIELRLNDHVVARGELVSVDDRFGVRISEIVQWPE